MRTNRPISRGTAPGLPLTVQGDKIGQNKLPARHEEALRRATPTADDIFKNMNNFNEEISESHGIPLDIPDEPVGEEEDIYSAEEGGAFYGDGLEDDISKDLERIRAQAAAEKRAAQQLEADKPQQTASEEPVNPETQMRDRIMDLLKKCENAPTERDIARWKHEYGEDNVNVVAFGDKDVYVFVPLTRAHWHKIQSTASEAAGTSAAPTQEKVNELIMESVIKYAVKWPSYVRSVEFAHGSKAGVIPTLHELIMLHSYFLNPAQAMLLTTKL